MKVVTRALLMVVLAAGAAVLVEDAPVTSEAQAKKPKAEPKASVVTLVHGTDELHPVMMALKVGTALVERGETVTLFLQVEAVRLAGEDQPLDLRWGSSAVTLGDRLSAFVDAGGTVLVCPHCAAAAGLEADDLREWATLATEEQVAEMFAAADKVIDY